jgi:hypothetical protein
VLFALARGAGMQGSVARVARNGAPIIALFTSAGLATVIMIIERLTGADVLDATFWSLTIGTIALLVAYALATLGAIRFLFFGGRTSTPKWQIVVPILAFALVLYTLYKNTVGVEPPYTWFPYLVLVWLLLGIGISFRPGLAERTRRSLESSDVP